MRSVFTWSAVLMMAVFATACVEGVDGVDDGEYGDGSEVEVEDEELPAPPDSPQSLNRNDDPDEGGQIKPKANNVARPTATR